MCEESVWVLAAGRRQRNLRDMVYSGLEPEDCSNSVRGSEDKEDGEELTKGVW